MCTRTVIMPFKFKRICPICGKEELQNISTHFSVVHNLDFVKRKQWLKLAKYQTMNTVYSRSTQRVRQQSKSITSIKRSPIKISRGKSNSILMKSAKKNYSPYTKEIYPEFRFHHPMSILVVGPTNSGKTYFVEQLLSTMNDKIKFKNKCKITWFYGQWQQCYQNMQKKLGKCIRFVQGLPQYNDDLGDIYTRYNLILVVDDLMVQAKDSPIVSSLFTQGRLCNNTDISRNAQYMVLFKSPADRKQIEIIGQRIFPKEQNKFMTIYNRETDRQHSYIIIDNTPSTSRDSQIVTNIFTKAHKIPFSSDLIKNQSLECSMEVASDNLKHIPQENDYQDPPQIIRAQK